MTSDSAERDEDVELRQRAMAICAEASRDELDEALRLVGFSGNADDLRRPEIGLVMLRGRIGSDGRAFNFGEATVSRAAVRLDTGETGFAYQLGRDHQKARKAAILDALLQSKHRSAVERALQPVADRLTAERDTRARQSAATRVNFFAMVRGEDA
jgi:alpha-D-ribose 1-methylphosphonate 5-triphosphate synthase subunit PhnG